MIPRDLRTELLASAASYPIVTLIGPRQSGRTAVLKLWPLSYFELAQANLDLSLDDWVLHGGYPRIYDQHLAPKRFYCDYLATYVERDVRQLINLKDVRQFQNFLRLFAGRVGQLLNMSQLVKVN